MAAPDIYPMFLDDWEATSLVREHFFNEFERERVFVSSTAKFTPGAIINEDGNVDLWVRYSFDSGFVSGSGSICRNTFRPFTDEQLEGYKRRGQLRYATDEWNKRQAAAEAIAIQNLAAELFGDQHVP
jgi:hypothetical protein